MLFLLLTLIPSILAGPMQQICYSQREICNQVTADYRSLVSGQSFSAKAFWSSALTTNVGSCGYNPSSLSTHLIALPIQFMPMSAIPNICNPNCNFLCGLCLRVRNTATGASTTVRIVDTALTTQLSVVLSSQAFTDIGGNLNNGVINIVFEGSSC